MNETVIVTSAGAAIENLPVGGGRRSDRRPVGQNGRPDDRLPFLVRDRTGNLLVLGC